MQRFVKSVGICSTYCPSNKETRNVTTMDTHFDKKRCFYLSLLGLRDMHTQGVAHCAITNECITDQGILQGEWNEAITTVFEDGGFTLKEYDMICFAISMISVLCDVEFEMDLKPGETKDNVKERLRCTMCSFNDFTIVDRDVIDACLENTDKLLMCCWWDDVRCLLIKRGNVSLQRRVDDDTLRHSTYYHISLSSYTPEILFIRGMISDITDGETASVIVEELAKDDFLKVKYVKSIKSKVYKRKRVHDKVNPQSKKLKLDDELFIKDMYYRGTRNYTVGSLYSKTLWNTVKDMNSLLRICIGLEPYFPCLDNGPNMSKGILQPEGYEGINAFQYISLVAYMKEVLKYYDVMINLFKSMYVSRRGQKTFSVLNTVIEHLVGSYLGFCRIYIKEYITTKCSYGFVKSHATELLTQAVSLSLSGIVLKNAYKQSGVDPDIILNEKYEKKWFDVYQVSGEYVHHDEETLKIIKSVLSNVRVIPNFDNKYASSFGNGSFRPRLRANHGNLGFIFKQEMLGKRMMYTYPLDELSSPCGSTYPVDLTKYLLSVRV